jgi:hypothetical protein
MLELTDEEVAAIREGAIPGMRFAAPGLIPFAVERAGALRQTFHMLAEHNLDQIDGAEQAPPEEGPAKAKSISLSRRPRKHSVDKLIAKAKAAGASSVLVDGVEMRFGEPQAEQTNDLDKWMAKRHAH